MRDRKRSAAAVAQIETELLLKAKTLSKSSKAASKAAARVEAAAAKIASGELSVHDYMSDDSCPDLSF